MPRLLEQQLSPALCTPSGHRERAILDLYKLWATEGDPSSCCLLVQSHGPQAPREKRTCTSLPLPLHHKNVPLSISVEMLSLLHLK